MLRASTATLLASLALSGVPTGASALMVEARTEPLPVETLQPMTGVLMLPNDRLEGRRPAVILVADALGPDGRADAYLELLLDAGVVVAEITLPDAEGSAAAVTDAARALARDPRVDPARIGVLGFGAGGRAALLAPRGRHGDDPVTARAALYPGCIGLAEALRAGSPGIAAGRSAVLLLHGNADAANPPDACAETAELLSHWAPTRHVVLSGAGYAWDRGAFPGEGSTLLPRPDGLGRVRTSPWPYLGHCSALAVADWFLEMLGLRSEMPMSCTELSFAAIQP